MSCLDRSCLRSIPPPLTPPPLYLLNIYLCSFSFLALNGAQLVFSTAVCLLNLFHHDSLCVCKYPGNSQCFLGRTVAFQHKHLKGKLTNWSVQIYFEEAKRGLSNCWLLKVSLAIFNSLLETSILWEFYLNYTMGERERFILVFHFNRSIPSITNRKRFKAKTDLRNQIRIIFFSMK